MEIFFFFVGEGGNLFFFFFKSELKNSNRRITFPGRDKVTKLNETHSDQFLYLSTNDF